MEPQLVTKRPESDRGQRTERPRLGEPEPGALRALFGDGPSLSESQLRGCLALPEAPAISPSASLRFRVEFQRFLMALSVLRSARAQQLSALRRYKAKRTPHQLNWLLRLA